MTRYITILTLFLIGLAIKCNAQKIEIAAPDLQKIKSETTDENSNFYYPKLLDKFFQNDTTMTDEEFRMLYYGAIYQEDYDPYRPSYQEETLKELVPLYSRSEHTRQEREKMRAYAIGALKDNPLDLVQLKNLIFVYEQNRKVNLAQIWKYKLNHLLRTIASSGTGVDRDNAWFIAYPRHEFDFLNISGVQVQNTEFVEPYYDKVEVPAKTEKDPSAYYFNLQPVLEQYYLKHPSEN